jgi:serine/threonine protein kinase
MQASPISVSNLTEAIESEIFKAYDDIHSLHVIHVDVRAENILVGKDGKSVWIVDFEFSEILTGDTDEDIQLKISQENEAISYLLSTIRQLSLVNGSRRNGLMAVR